MTFVKNHIQKQPFLKFLPIFTMSQCFFDSEVRDKKKQMVIWKFSEKESPFFMPIFAKLKEADKL